jgi:hypothetical protein
MIAALKPEEIVAFAIRMDELARAEPRLFDCGFRIVGILSAMLNDAQDLAARREDWPAREDDEESYAIPPHWQRAIDTVEKLWADLDAERQRCEAEERAERRRARRKEKQIATLRARLQALEAAPEPVKAAATPEAGND